MHLQAISTWNVTSDLAEAKHFAIGIYNIAVIGGIAYFLSIYIGSTNAGAGIILRCVGICLSATLAVAVIIVPKLLAIGGVVNLLTGDVHGSSNDIPTSNQGVGAGTGRSGENGIGLMDPKYVEGHSLVYDQVFREVDLGAAPLERVPIVVLQRKPSEKRVMFAQNKVGIEDPMEDPINSVHPFVNEDEDFDKKI